ncbi:MAG TPA: fluoride efflux transporter CrcB [Pseudogracilibacillus sp.]|nr:fluoride efflux transporter CrcB [Pseudogracilibacillus sp.]
MIYVYVGIGGAIGALLRYTISLFFVINDTNFPYSTLFVNMIGSFLLAYITYGLFEKIKVKQLIKLAITTGFFGSFTTFSALSVETLELAQEGQILHALLYVFISLFGGILATYLGYLISKGRKVR